MNRSLAIVGGSAVCAVVGALALQAHAVLVEKTTTVTQQTATLIDCSLPGIHCIRVFMNPKNKLKVDSDPLVKSGENTSIYWFIELTPKHLQLQFAPGGIAFSAGDGGQAEFSCVMLQNLTYRCFDVEGNPASPNPDKGYKYTVSVIDAGSPVPALDPHIVNN